MSEHSQPTEFRPTVVKDAIRRHMWLIVLLPLIGSLLGVAAVSLVPKQHESVAGVLINPLDGNPFAPDGEGDQLTNLETEAQIVTSDPVASSAAKALGAGAPTGPELSRLARGSVPTNTQVIQISSTSSVSAAQAQAQTQAFAEAFLAYRRGQTEALVAGRLKTLAAQEKTTRELLAKATVDLAKQEENDANRTLLTEQVRNHSAELARLTSAIAETSATPTNPGQIVTPADLPVDGRNRLMAIGGLVGLLAALGVAVLTAVVRERLDDRVRDSNDLDRLGVGWLGTLANPQAVVSPERSELPDELRRLRTVVLSAVRSRPAVIVIGRAEMTDHIPACARPLAVALARADVRVCLVNAGSRGPAEVALGTDNPGLAGVLLDGVPVKQVIEPTARNLATIPQGTWFGAASDVLGNAPMLRLLGDLRSAYDVVLVAAPSLDGADGRLLAELADAVAVEATAMRTTNAQIIDVVQELRGAGIGLLGAVIVGPRRAGRRVPGALRRTPRPGAADAGKAPAAARPGGTTNGAVRRRDDDGSTGADRVATAGVPRSVLPRPGSPSSRAASMKLAGSSRESGTAADKGEGQPNR